MLTLAFFLLLEVCSSFLPLSEESNSNGLTLEFNEGEKRKKSLSSTSVFFAGEKGKRKLFETNRFQFGEDLFQMSRLTTT